MTPSQKARELLGLCGYTVERVEYDNFHNGRTWKRDFLNFGDFLAFKPRRFILVQATSSTNVSARVNKISAEPRHRLWLKAGGEIVVIGTYPMNRKQPRLVAWVDGEPQERPVLEYLQ
jgi:hypothetical protein